MSERTMVEKMEALAEYLGLEGEELIFIDMSREQGTVKHFIHRGTPYLVLTDEEANTEVRRNMRETLWCFDADFLSAQTSIPEIVFEKLCDLYEKGNEAIEALIEQTCGLDDFIEVAVDNQGRAHFLSAYDGEHEQGRFFIYLQE